MKNILFNLYGKDFLPYKSVTPGCPKSDRMRLLGQFDIGQVIVCPSTKCVLNKKQTRNLGMSELNTC